MLAPTRSHIHLHLAPLSFLDKVLLHSPGWSGIHDLLALASKVLVFLTCATTPGPHLIHSHVITCMFALILIVPYYHDLPQVWDPVGTGSTMQGLLEKLRMGTEVYSMGHVS